MRWLIYGWYSQILGSCCNGGCVVEISEFETWHQLTHDIASNYWFDKGVNHPDGQNSDTCIPLNGQIILVSICIAGELLATA